MTDVSTDIELARFLGCAGKYAHFCPDWDFMAIDETCPEFEVCLCYNKEVT